jgi:DNA-binding CsgD family transcriptional regulator
MPMSRPAVRRLSERERQVARLVAEGLKDTVIARRLGLSASTVGTYVRHIQQRLHLDSRAEIAAWVTARLDPDDPTGRLRRPAPMRTTGAHPDVRAS